MSVTLRGKKATGAWIGATDYPELIIGEKRDWLQRHRRKSKRRRLAAREKTGGPFKAECADRSNLGPIPASRVFLLFPFSLRFPFHPTDDRERPTPSRTIPHRFAEVYYQRHIRNLIERLVKNRVSKGWNSIRSERIVFPSPRAIIRKRSKRFLPRYETVADLADGRKKKK